MYIVECLWEAQGYQGSGPTFGWLPSAIRTTKQCLGGCASQLRSVFRSVISSGQLGWHYLSNATCLTRPPSRYAFSSCQGSP